MLAFVLVLRGLPEGVGFGDALAVAGASGRMRAVDVTFDPTSRYNLWAGLLGGFFLQLSYFGTDQSQVGRILTAGSERASRFGLLCNGLLKVPMQAAILLLGVLVFVAYRFEPAPIMFDPTAEARALAGPQADVWRSADTVWREARAELARELRAVFRVALDQVADAHHELGPHEVYLGRHRLRSAEYLHHHGSSERVQGHGALCTRAGQ